MITYGSISELERGVMGTVVVISNVFGFPSIISLLRRKGL
jgi:hypothetical protein